MGCDFKENDIGNEPSSGEDCSKICSLTSRCTHFSWSKGVCYKKSGTVNKNTAYIRTNYVCGVIDDSKLQNFFKYIKLVIHFRV